MDGSGQKALLEVWEWSGVLPEGLGVIGRPPEGQGVFERSSRRAGSGREALLDGQEWSEGPPGFWEWSGVSPEGLGVIKRPPGRQGVFERSSRRARSGREWLGGHPEGPAVVRSAVPEGQVWSRTLPEGGSGREALPEDRECSRDPPGELVVVRRPSRMVGSVRETLPKGLERSRGPFGRSRGHPGGPGLVGKPFWSPGVVVRPFRRFRRPSQRAGSGQEALPEGRKRS